jgi:hypothetical protein
VLLSVRDVDKPGVVDLALRVARLGFGLLATPGTAEFLRRAGVSVTTVAKVGQGSPNVLDLLERSEIQLLVDTALSADEIRGNRQLRAGAVRRRVPYCSRLSGARAMVDAIERQQGPALEARPLQAYADQRGLSDPLDRRPLVQAGDGVPCDGNARMIHPVNDSLAGRPSAPAGAREHLTLVDQFPSPTALALQASTRVRRPVLRKAAASVKGA